MRHLFKRAIAPAWLALLCACASTAPAPRPAAILHYQHVANVHRLYFTNPLRLPGARVPVQFMAPVDADGFWAVFVLCSVDVTRHAARGFQYDASKFRIGFDGRSYGAPQPFTMRYQALSELNTPADLAPLHDAIAAELQEGPPEQLFMAGFHPGLNYRFAVFVPKALANYSGGQLALRYEGQPALMVGNGYPPSDLRAAGGSAAGVASACLP